MSADREPRRMIDRAQLEVLELATLSSGLGVIATDPDGYIQYASGKVREICREWGTPAQWWREIAPRLTPPTSGMARGPETIDVTSPAGNRWVYDIRFTGSMRSVALTVETSVYVVEDVTRRSRQTEELARVSRELDDAFGRVVTSRRAQRRLVERIGEELSADVEAVDAAAIAMAAVDSKNGELAAIRAASMRLRNRLKDLERELRDERRRRRHAETLRSLRAEITLDMQPSEVGDQIIDGLRELVECDRALLLVVEGEDLVAIAARGTAGETGQVIWRREPALAHVVRASAGEIVRCAPAAGIAALEEDASGDLAWFGAPLRRGNTLTALVLFRAPADQSVSADDAERLAAYFGQGAVAMDTVRRYAEIQRQTRTDTLTGLWERRYLFEQGEAVFRRARHSGMPLAVLVVDIDLLADINQLHGHEVGDEVIREVAARTRRCLRSDDIVGRYGGDELLVLLNDTSLGPAVEVVAERIRQACAFETVDTGAGPLLATVSVGVARCLAGHETLGDVIADADGELYRAKRSGRNCVCSTRDRVLSVSDASLTVAGLSPSQLRS